MNETQQELPDGWMTTGLSVLVDRLESGKRPKGGVRGIISGTPSIGGEHLNDEGSFNLATIKYVPETFANEMTTGRIQINDILVVKDGATTGKSAFVSGSFPYRNAVINEHIFIIRIHPSVNSKYVFFWIWSQKGKQQVLKDFRGAAQGGISTQFLSYVDLSLPPLAEQQRIVAKIEELFSSLDKGIESLKTAQAQLKVYRQAVLKQAFEGKLTNKNVKDGELPEGWKIKELREVCEIKRGVSKHRPRDAKELYGGNYPFIQTGDVRAANGGIIRKYSQTYNETGLNQSRLWPKNTLCLTIAANIGDTAFLGFDACFPDSVVGVIEYYGLSNINYISYYMQRVKQDLNRIAPATAQKNINVDILGKVPFPLPTDIATQEAVVFEIESRLSVCDKLEESIRQSLEQAEALRQSILKKAFEGKLVPQDSNDEPASVLLERIRAEREKNTSKVTRTKASPAASAETSVARKRGRPRKEG